jgi:hypothetical protein
MTEKMNNLGAQSMIEERGNIRSERMRFVDIVQLLGSVASITGISLLWLQPYVGIDTVLLLVPLVALGPVKK